MDIDTSTLFYKFSNNETTATESFFSLTNSTNTTTWFIEMSSTMRIVNQCLAVVEGVQGVMIVLCNALVLALIFQEREKFSSRLSNYHVVSLVCSDMVQGFINVPTVMFIAQGITVSHPMCFMVTQVAATTGFTQILIIMAMTVDRYWAIVHALHYKKHATVEKMIGECWVI